MASASVDAHNHILLVTIEKQNRALMLKNSADKEKLAVIVS
jgi:hypothetical protein